MYRAEERIINKNEVTPTSSSSPSPTPTPSSSPNTLVHTDPDSREGLVSHEESARESVNRETEQK